MNAHTGIALVLAVTLAGGCSLGNSLTTGSILGGGETKAAAPAVPEVKNDPATRALQVGKIAARASRCGYNFDPVALKGNFLASEAALGISVADLSSVERVYDTAFSGVSKAITNPDDYCNAAKTASIKSELSRHLAGDYSPAPPPKVAAADDGLFSGFFGNETVDKGPTFGSDSWWDKQRENAGK